MEHNTVQHLSEASFDQAVVGGVAVVDFWAAWCGPCRMIAPVLDELAGEVADDVVVAKVNVDDEPSLAARFRVQGIPLLVFFRDGHEVGRLVGAGSKNAIRQGIEAARKIELPTQAR